ncbi:MAG: hypothetical protein HYY31_02085 [Chloroflexi bacterium]|nr:hypothetical protein [Chloroflexota bacterium]
MAGQADRRGKPTPVQPLPRGTPLEQAGRLSARDLYRLRRARQMAAEAALHTQLAQHRLDALVLELEHRYSLLGRDVTINVHTGHITLRTNQRQPVGGEEAPLLDRTGAIPPKESDPVAKERGNGSL